MAEIAKIAQGNNFNIAIPLKVYILNEGEVVLEDYTPAEGDDVTIRLVGERRGYTYKPTTEGNVAHLQLSGHEVCDTYAVEVVIISTDGTMLRSYRGDQLAIVYNVDTIIADGAVQDGELYLDSQFFIQGQKGEQGDPGQDGTDGRGIVSVTKTATQGLVDTYTITYTDGTTSTFEVTNGKDGSGGGGDDALIVTLTYQSGTYIADKTYNEITAAIQAGRNVLVFSSVSQDYATLSRATSGKVEFSHIESVGSQMMGQFLVCNSNDTWATSSKTIQQGLVSGTSIKTINSTSLLGSGDIEVTTPGDLAAVATSGNYNDLKNKPTIPAAQVNADWDAASGVAQILNKPTIPTKTSDLTNDSDFVDSAAMTAALSGKQDVTAIVSSNFPASFAPNVLYDFGTTDSVTFGNLAAGASGIVNLYLCTWTCQTDACSVALPQGVVIAGGESLEIKAGRTFEITIRDNKLSFLYFD